MRIVVCLTGNNFSGNFLDCYGEMLHYFYKRNYHFAINRKESSNVYHVRALALGADVSRGRNQKPFGGQIDYDWILWIDSDIVFTPKDIEALLMTKGDIVSGLYIMQNNTTFTAVKDWDTEYYKEHSNFKFVTRENLKEPGYKLPFEVSYVGMGFMAVRKGVYEAIPYPWFEPESFDLGNGMYDFCSEDVAFCLKAKRAGFKIVVNPAIIVGHEKKIVL